MRLDHGLLHPLAVLLLLVWVWLSVVNAAQEPHCSLHTAIQSGGAKWPHFKSQQPIYYYCTAVKDFSLLAGKELFTWGDSNPARNALPSDSAWVVMLTPTKRLTFRLLKLERWNQPSFESLHKGMFSSHAAVLWTELYIQRWPPQWLEGTHTHTIIHITQHQPHPTSLELFLVLRVNDRVSLHQCWEGMGKTGKDSLLWLQGWKCTKTQFIT